MSKNRRKALADEELLKTLASRADLARDKGARAHNRVYAVTAILWAILAALPAIHIGRPIPFMLGSTATHDTYSRVEFTWHDHNAEAQAMRNLEASYSRRYREESLPIWAAETYVPVEKLLTAAATATSAGQTAAFAAELGVAATPEEIARLWRGAAVARNDPYHYLVSPMKEILDNEIFQQGILAADRYEIERGRSIQVSHGDSSYTAMIGGERGPVTLAQLADVLQRRFRARISAWVPDDFKTALRDILIKRLKPTLIYDEAASRAGFEERRQELLSRVQTVKPNDILLSRGAIVTTEKRDFLREEDRVFRAAQGWRQPATRFGGNFILFAAISLAVVIYFKATEARRRRVLLRYFAALVLALALVWVGYGLIYMGLPGTMLPAGVAIGAAAFGMGGLTALFMTGVASLCGLILFEGRPDLMVAHLAAGMFFIHGALRCRWRIALVVTSFASGVIGATLFIAWNFARGDIQALFSFTQIINDAQAAFISALALVLNWVLCGLLIMLFLPLVERYFGSTTRIRLQDLASQEHPILRRLIVEAPGTYHHCSVVSTLAEAGANAIGADGLRARIGGMFHDIGKVVKPEYFTENEFGVSRHERMNPNMSALLIINHVRDGAEMAKSFRLPAVVTDMILQHHGDAMMRFFHHKAVQQAPAGTVVAREPFLYPGPKPQTPEAGILMIADSVEAAVRSLDTPSPAHLKTMLARIIHDRLVEGQFEESGLTMRQLKQIEEVLFRMLVSMYHTRVKYPGHPAEAVRRGRQ